MHIYICLYIYICIYICVYIYTHPLCTHYITISHHKFIANPSIGWELPAPQAAEDLKGAMGFEMI